MYFNFQSNYALGCNILYRDDVFLRLSEQKRVIFLSEFLLFKKICFYNLN